MLKHHIKGTDIFEIDPIVNERLLLTSKYDNIIKKIGYPFYAETMQSVKNMQIHTSYKNYDYSRKDDFYLPYVRESNFIKNIHINKVNNKKREKINPLFFDLLPTQQKNKINIKENNDVNNIIHPPKLNKPFVFENTPAIEMGLENYTEGEMVLKKMTDDMIEETGDDSYYENFLTEHLQKKYKNLYPVSTPITNTSKTSINPTKSQSKIPILSKKNKTPTVSISSPIVPSKNNSLSLTSQSSPIQLDPSKNNSLSLTAQSITKPVLKSPRKIPPESRLPISITPQLISANPSSVSKKLFIDTPTSSNKKSIKTETETETIIESQNVFNEKETELQLPEKVEKTTKTSSVNSNLIVEDFMRLHPRIFNEYKDVVKDYTIGGKVDNKGKEKLNIILSRYGKKLIPMNYKILNTILHSFSINFMEGKKVGSSTKKNVLSSDLSSEINVKTPNTK